MLGQIAVETRSKGWYVAYSHCSLRELRLRRSLASFHYARVAMLLLTRFVSLRESRSVVDRLLAKEKAAGSNPVSRSKKC